MNNSNLIPETAPFREEDRRWLKGFLPSLSPEQTAWVEGFLARHRAGFGNEGDPPAEPAQSERPAGPRAVPLTVLYGTESGNSEGLADETAKRAKQAGFHASPVDMADLQPSALREKENLLVIVSTWGDGDPPEGAEGFYEKLMSDGMPRLDGLRFSVCGLGDTAYDAFCKMGKDFDGRLEALGATRIAPRVDCDIDFRESYESWAQTALAELERRATETNGTARGTVVEEKGASVAPITEPTVDYTARNPFPAEVVEKVSLSPTDSAKENLHLELSLAGSGLRYEPGDSLGLVAANDPELVDRILATAGFSGDEEATIKEETLPLREALSTRLEIAALTPPVLASHASTTGDENLRDLLQDERKADLREYLRGRDVLDLLQDFPAKFLTPAQLTGALRPLQPRLYSLASSLRAHPDQAHLTVGVVRYSAHGRERGGVCTTDLADRLNKGDKVGIYLSRNKTFKLPRDPDTPILMIGPGTGVAPFRAFVEERAAAGARGRSWLFFGEQHYLHDFLYQLEWQEHLKTGALTKLNVAFSRDQPEKVYVQHRMHEHGREVFAWLEEGAHLYVCGDAQRMAADVHAALEEIVAREGAMTGEQSAEYVKRLKAEKRYLRDVY